MIPNMTAQQIFDKVAIHLLTQNKRAIDEDKICKYRTEDGLKCAVGCLIPDEDYDPRMELMTFPILFLSPNRQRFPQLHPLHDHISILQELQRIHDRSLPETWKHRLTLLAEQFDLNPEVLEKFR